MQESLHWYSGDHMRVDMEQMIEQVEKRIKGKRQVIELVLQAALCGGHVLLEDVPGVGKTLLARTLAEVCGTHGSRIQFHPDVLPSDVTGVSIYQRSEERFVFHPGPLFAHVVLADEINRAPSRTQAALLEAMEEGGVTVDGKRYALPAPFILIATQNPQRFEGVNPLPEAQLDRFLFKLSLGYPSLHEEVALLALSTQETSQIEAVMDTGRLAALQTEVSRVRAESGILRLIATVAEATRRHPEVALGASPRASLALLQAARACAWFAGRDYVIPDDVKMRMHPVLGHRLVMKRQHGTASGIATVYELLDTLYNRLPVA